MKTDMRRQVLSGILQQKICSIKETGELRMEVPKADAAGKTAELDREKTLAVQKEYENDGDITFDTRFKNVFSNEKILATVIKYTVEQYKDLSIEEIVPLIGKAELEREVSAGMTNVSGSELSDIKEHTVRFDLFVPVRLPESAVCTGSTADSITFRIFYDLEMQREWKPAYLLEKRVLYYAARMVSAQKKIITDSTVYQDLQQAHTVWIVLAPETYELVNQRIGFGIKCISDIQGYTDRQKQAVAEAESKIDLMRATFLYIDKSILRTRIVKGGIDEAVEFVSLMFAKALNSERMREKYINFWDAEVEREVDSMVTHLNEMQRERAKGRAEGRTEGRTEGIIKSGRRHGFSNEVIIEDIMAETGCSLQNAKEVLKHFDLYAQV